MEIVNSDVSKTRESGFTEFVIIVDVKTALDSLFRIMFRVVPSRKAGVKLIYRHDENDRFGGFNPAGKLVDENRMTYKKAISDVNSGMFL